MFSKQLPAAVKVPKKNRQYLKVTKVEDHGEAMTLTFENPNHIQVNPGQYFSTHLPREFMKPLTLAISSGSNDEQLQFTFQKAAHKLSIKGFLESFKFHPQM